MLFDSVDLSYPLKSNYKLSRFAANHDNIYF